MYSLKQIIISILIAAVVFTAVGFLGAGMMKRVSGVSVDKTNSNLRIGLELAYDRLIRRGHAAIVARGFGFRESNTIGGEVREISENKIILVVNPINPLADPILDTRSVKITSSTKFYQMVEKSEEQLNQEIEEYGKLLEQEPAEGATRSPELPDFFAKQEIDRSEMEIGKTIEVTAKDNIHNVKNFDALEIIVR